jgi:hypothetical protein
MTFNHLGTTQLHQFEIKLKYLPHFFSVWNVAYTMRSSAAYFLPTSLLKQFSQKPIRSGPGEY